jgi:hypothetical protein
MSKEQLDKLNSISKKSNWISDAKKRRRNWWWKKHWNKIHLKYLRLKRRIKPKQR